MSARILVAEEVLDKSAIVPEADDEDKLSVFKEFIDTLNFEGGPGSEQQS